MLFSTNIGDENLGCVPVLESVSIVMASSVPDPAVAVRSLEEDKSLRFGKVICKGHFDIF